MRCCLFLQGMLLALNAAGQNESRLLWQADPSGGSALFDVTTDRDTLALFLVEPLRIKTVNLADGTVESEVNLEELSESGQGGIDMLGRVSFSPNGTWLAALATRELHVWDNASPGGNPAISFTAVSAMDFIPNTENLAVWKHGNIEIWDLDTATMTTSLQVGPTDSMGSIDVSENGELLATAASFWSEDAHVEHLNIWSLPSGEKRISIPGALHQLDHALVALSPDATRVALASRGRLRIWSTSDGVLLNEIELPISLPGQLEFSSNEAHVGIHDLRSTIASGLLDIDSQEMITRWDHPRPFEFSGDGQSYLAWHQPSHGPLGLYEHPLPATLLAPSTTNGQTTLRWIGRDGQFQVQETTMISTAWANVGEPTTERAVTIPTESTSSFFRLVESAP